MPFALSALKKRAILVLTGAILGSGLLVVCFGRSTPGRAEHEKPTAKPNLSEARTNGGGGSEPGDNPDSPGGFSYDPDTGIYSDLVRAILLVVVLGAGAVYVSKKLLPKITNLPGREVRVIETVYLGPRRAVHVLEVGSRRFLVGSTNENITKLADITDDFPDISAQEVVAIENADLH